MLENWDVIVVGGGSSGLPTAFFAAARGARVLLIDHAPQLGGTLWVASGQMSAAGTRLQQRKGIEDSADAHYDDVMRISRGSADPQLVRLAVDNAASTFDWLEDQGFRALPDHPVEGNAHEPYQQSRYYWGEQGGHSVKDVLVPLVMQQVQAGRITLKLEHEVTELLITDDGAVAGVVARDQSGATSRFLARSTALTCGGYAANPELFEQLNGYPQYTAQPYPYARGAGIRLGMSAGGYLRGQQNVYNNFGSLLDGDQFPCPLAARVVTYPEMRQPWEIYVNAHGDRFVREDMESVDARENALLEQPDQRYWVVFDERILTEAPPFIAGFNADEIRALFLEKRPFFYKADDLRKLASAAGIDADGLMRAVRGYNYGVHSGNDFLGRRHLPLPIAQGPFYAIRVQGAAVSSAVGLAVNDQLQVIRPDGSAIPGLWAAGELLGASQTMGRAVCGGMMAPPALTFARLLGQSLIPLTPRT